MTSELHLALSPYFLATREVQAVAALVLGTRVVTLLPTPREGHDRASVRAAVDRVPRYLRLMESWRWSTPLWRAGVIAACHGGRICAEELDGVYQRIGHEQSLQAVRPLTRHVEVHRRASALNRDAASGEEPDGEVDPYLNALAADLLKGGPDPGINIPITAALDRFAQTNNLIAVRSGVDSIAQRAESRLARRIFSIGIPMLTRGSGTVIEELREELADQLDALRHAIVQCVGAANAKDTNTQATRDLAAAARTFGAAFDDWASENIPGDDDEGERLTAGYVNITGVELPEDAVLLASRAAARTLHGTPPSSPSPLPTAVSSAPSSSAGAQTSARRTLLALVIREMNVQPAAADDARATRADRA